MTTGEAVFFVLNGALGFVIGRGWVDQAAGYLSAFVAETLKGRRK